MEIELTQLGKRYNQSLAYVKRIVPMLELPLHTYQIRDRIIALLYHLNDMLDTCRETGGKDE